MCGGFIAQQLTPVSNTVRIGCPGFSSSLRNTAHVQPSCQKDTFSQKLQSIFPAKSSNQICCLSLSSLYMLPLKDKFYKITILIPQDKKLKLKFNYDCCFILIQRFFQSLILSLISVVIPSNSWLFDCVNELINCRKLQTAGNS